MKKKILALSLALGMFALIMSASTLAFFTDKTEAITNTFTVGRVDIELTEPEEDNWGLNADGTAKIVMMPGGEYAKTPTITVKEDSQDAWVFATLQLGKVSDFVTAVTNSYDMSQLSQMTPEQLIGELGNYIGGFDASKWDVLNFDLSTGTFTVMYKEKLSAGDSVKLFTSIKMPKELKSKAFPEGSFKNGFVTVTAYAIQAEGITAENAYNEATNEGLFVNE